MRNYLHVWEKLNKVDYRNDLATSNLVYDQNVHLPNTVDIHKSDCVRACFQIDIVRPKIYS